MGNMGRTTNIIDQIFDINHETKNSVQRDKQNFNLIQCESHIKGLSWYLPENSESKYQTIFNRLKDYFEIGLFFSLANKEKASWKLNQLFYYKKFSLGQEVKTNSIIFPEMNLLKVYKSKVDHLLNDMGLEMLADDAFTSILYQIDQENIFCFFTAQADPWLSLRLEKIVKEIRNGIL